MPARTPRRIATDPPSSVAPPKRQGHGRPLSDPDPLSTFRSPPGEHLLAILGTHSHPKPVRPLAARLARLIRALHRSTPSSSVEESKPRNLASKPARRQGERDVIRLEKCSKRSANPPPIGPEVARRIALQDHTQSGRKSRAWSLRCPGADSCALRPPLPATGEPSSWLISLFLSALSTLVDEGVENPVLGGFARPRLAGEP